MKKVPIGVDNFKRLIEEDYYYVDKTKVIEELLVKGASVVLFTRPRRFGKSLLLSTLDYFFNIEKSEENKNLFDDLYISKSEYSKEFGGYPVIRLDFKDLKGDNFESIYNAFKSLISKVYLNKKYVFESLEETEKKTFNNIMNKEGSLDDYKNSLVAITNYLEKYYKKRVIVLIDEYDTPINEGYSNGFYKEIMELIQPVLSMCFKGNDSLKMGILTGVLRVVKESLFSTFNNLDVYDVMTRSESGSYGEYFGFTKPETEELLKYYGLELTSEVSGLYDGYNIGGSEIYNPWSILNYADKKELKPYWINTGSNKIVRRLLENLKAKEKISLEQLIEKNSITFKYREGITFNEIDGTSDLETTLNFLLSSGYLTFDRSEESLISDDEINYFKLPNREVRKEFINIIQNITYDNLTNTHEYEEFLNSLVNGEKEKIEKFINISLNSMSYHDAKELFYHGYMLGLFGGFLNNKFIVKSNREAGSGRYDLMIERVDKTLGIIIELKICDTLEEMETKALDGINQMKEKEYYKELILDKITNIKTIVIVFCEKQAIVR